jgi:hypothetical protein
VWGRAALAGLVLGVLAFAAEVALAAVLSVALLHRCAHRPRWGWFTAAAGTLLAVALAAWSAVEAVRLTGF